MISELSRREKLKLLLKHLKPQSLLLEVGAGDGWFSIRLRQRGYQVVTLDLKEPADFVGDIMNWKFLGLQEQSFDVVVALEVIEHVDCLEALCTLCKKNGLIMLSSPHPKWDWLMKILESLKLTQKRTSEHINLIDFHKINLKPLIIKRPLYIHQIGIFINRQKNNCAN
ncbi:MAG: class I SAM-dependent methyltransferase [Candidatus Saccharicenans sp.]|nr:class I SAM-dependent methyltransferase [Candidatus Saccharicenans sp.]